MESTRDEIPAQIGPYAILQSLGRGGMGEVFLAKDPSCGRLVALKRIRPDLRENKVIQNRFLREVRVASTLTHPSIVPILFVQMTAPDIYYTMPFIEGETLRHILRKNKADEPLHPLGQSIPSLTRIFLQVCEAIAYTHSKGILHRDLKPENIIVGKYGEVMIFDWGIADFIDQIGKEEDPETDLPKEEDLTRPGKITGTLAYMSPERLTRQDASVQTDIYALGVILYQILTLQLPFQRKNIATFRKKVNSEEWLDPLEISPHRDIPLPLAAICKKCLARNPSERYKNMEDLIANGKNYIEGRPEWIHLGELDLSKKSDWQFQENILLAKHIAITRSLDVTEWAALAISKGSFPENLRIDAEIQMDEECQGIGFLLGIPEPDTRRSLEESYCLWLSSSSCKLFRNNVQIMETKDSLKEKDWHRIRIEKIEDHVRFYLDDVLKIHFTSHLPIGGSHVGFLHKDAHFSLRKWSFYDGSHNLMINCLSVPNAFLSHKLYDLALREYRRIGQSFPGRLEGREALFRAGLTLIEKGKEEKNERSFHLALREFEKLYRTAGAPLEYLGKSMVYEALHDFEEEAKCLELALRKFPRHFLLFALMEHIVYRMHESSLNNREAAYRIILLALRHIPNLLDNPDTKSLIESLQTNWEPLHFIEESEELSSSIAIQLAFWLAKRPILIEIAESFLKKEPVNEVLLGNALFSLLELGALKEIEKFLDLPYARILSLRDALEPLEKAKFSSQMTTWEYRCLYYRMRASLEKQEWLSLAKAFHKIQNSKFPPSQQLRFDALEVWSHLLQKDLEGASQIFKRYPLSLISQESSPLHFPYGTFIYLKEGPEAAMAYFNAVLETPHPPTTALASYFLTGRIDAKQTFWWEKQELSRQLDLFDRVVKEKHILGNHHAEIAQSQILSHSP